MRAWLIPVVVFAAAACGGSSVAPASGSGAQKTLTITTAGDGVVRGAGVDCRGNCVLQIAAGQQVHLQAVADAGAPFVAWSGACSGSGACDLTLDADRAVTATFGHQPPPPAGFHRLNVSVQGTGRVISTPPGIDCASGASCTTTLPDGTGVTLVATPGALATFAGWTGNCSGTSACSFVLTGDAAVSARFSQPPPPPSKVTLAVSVTGPGTVTGAGINCGAGGNACSTSVDSGSTVALTAAPNAHVRFMSWGGGCTGAATPCQVAMNANTSVTATFEDEVRVISANDFHNNTTVLAINSTQVFYARNSSEEHQIWSAPKAGGDAKKLIPAFATYLVADDSYLYWTDGAAIYSMPAAGGTASLIASHANIGKLALDGAGALYFPAYPYPSGSIYRLQNRVESVLAPGQSTTGAIAVDADYVWFSSRSDSNLSIDSIRRVSKQGGAVTDLTTTYESSYKAAIRVDSTNVYYRNFNGEVKAIAKTALSGNPVPLWAPNGASSTGFYDLEVNASVVWWNWATYSNTGGGLFRANADGTAFTTVDTGVVNALRVDDTAVYYFHEGALIKRLK